LLYERYRKIAKEMIAAAVKAADPTEAIKRNVSVDGDTLRICDLELKLSEFDRVLLFGIGKASTTMARAFEEILTPDDGLVITKAGDEINLVELKSVPVYEAYHPEPREINVEVSRKIVDMVEAIKPDEKVLIIFMISGGGSALFTVPAEGISVDDMFKLNQIMMKWGGNIYQINTIRKHVCQVKGGRFAQLCSRKGATLASLILSDVVGDDLSVIASGPTYKDDTTFADAIDLLKRFNVWDECPQSVRDHLEKGLENPDMEPPRTVPPNTYNFLIGNNMVALRAAEEIAKREGFNTMILTSQNLGEAKEVAKAIMGIAKEVQDSGNPIKPPAALILGGEMIVTFKWEERDGFGPNREFVLSSAIEIANRKNIVVAGADTDGEDGQGKSGAIADCRTVHRTDLDARWYLDKHEAEAFFDALGDSLEFTSQTNVNDIDVILIGEKED
jgi:glycerate 2-kinase